MNNFPTSNKQNISEKANIAFKLHPQFVNENAFGILSDYLKIHPSINILRESFEKDLQTKINSFDDLLKYIIEHIKKAHITISCITIDDAKNLAKCENLLRKTINKFAIGCSLKFTGLGFDDNEKFNGIRVGLSDDCFTFVNEFRDKYRIPDYFEEKQNKLNEYIPHISLFHPHLRDFWRYALENNFIDLRISGLIIKPVGRNKKPFLEI